MSGPRVHLCEAEGCEAWGAFGFGPPLRREQAWACADHRHLFDPRDSGCAATSPARPQGMISPDPGRRPPRDEEITAADPGKPGRAEVVTGKSGERGAGRKPRGGGETPATPDLFGGA